MNTTKEETIIALLDSPKVASVKVEFDNGESFVIDVPYTLAVLNGKTIKSFKVNLVPITEFNVGDVVWVISENVEAIISNLHENSDEAMLMIPSVGGAAISSTKNLILIKKGELNNG